MRKWTLLAAGALFLGIAAAGAAQAQTAKAELKNAGGEKVGEATLQEAPHGVLVTVNLTNVPAGTHAFHIHETGKCEPPFKSAGGHFNPTHKEHGFENPKWMHAGDYPNVEVPEGGKAHFQLFAPAVTPKAGENSLFDSDGSSLVMHAGADDYKSDPAGNAGDRIACGVIVK